ncbi:MAG: Ig-like domain repeat protein, partial [Thaumarchaeota archaeon]|nr:Ig-like domain repeat protein [Nitrososphaerota archaeon]
MQRRAKPRLELRARLAVLLLLALLLAMALSVPISRASAQSPNLGTVFGSADLGTVGASYESAYDSGSGYVYVANMFAGTLTVMSGTAVESIITGLPTYPFYPAYNSGTGELYVRTQTGVAVISGSSVAANIADGLGIGGIAYDSANGYVYAGAIYTNTVSVVSGTTLVTTISGFSGPYNILYDPGNGDVYVANFFAHTLSLVSGTSIVGTVNLSNSPNGLAYDSASGDIYVSMEGGSTAVVSGTTVTATVSGVGGNGAAYDSANGYVYVCCDGNSNLGVISGTTVLGSIAVGGFGGYGVTYDSVDGYIYVVNGGSESQNSDVTVYVIQTPLLASTTTSVVCDPVYPDVGHTSTCTATVSGSSPTGQVTFTASGAGSVSPATQSCGLSGGSCAVTFSGASVGDVSIGTSYAGDGGNLGSSGSASITVVNPTITVIPDTVPYTPNPPFSFVQINSSGFPASPATCTPSDVSTCDVVDVLFTQSAIPSLPNCQGSFCFELPIYVTSTGVLGFPSGYCNGYGSCFQNTSPPGV